MKHSKWLWFGSLVLVFCISIFTTKSWHKYGRHEVGHRAPAQVEIPKDFLQATEYFLDYIRNPESFTYKSCDSFLGQVYSSLMNSSPDYFDYQSLQANHKTIAKNLWLIRLELLQRIREMNARGELKGGLIDDHCIVNLRAIVRAARFVEDYLGETFMGFEPYVEGRDSVALNTLQGDEPQLMKAPGVEVLKLKSGDFIISRGNAFTSAAIARMGEEDSQFSHLAVLYFDGDSAGKELTIAEALKDPNVKVLEAHIEVGITIRPFAEYAADGNARNAVFRYFDSAKAHEAAKWTFQLIKERVRKKIAIYFEDPSDAPEWTYEYTNLDGQKVKSVNPDAVHPDYAYPYDFQMNLGDLDGLFCSEVGYVGFKHLGIQLPMFPTKIAAKSELVTVLGVKSLVNFLPGDMELDPRFQYLAEWRDYRKLRNIRYKDAILSSMYDWMKTKDYKFHPSFESTKTAILGWIARKFSFKKTLTKLPPYMSIKMIKTVMTIDEVGEKLQKFVSDLDAQYRKSHNGLGMTFSEIKKALEQFRSQDEALFLAKKESLFHKRFNGSK